jgi:hypothetical protein
MSIKRTFENTFVKDSDSDDSKLEEILSVRKLRKHVKDDYIGFCDICEKLTSVRKDPDHPQFNYCINCEIGELSFFTEFMEIGTKPVIEKIDDDHDNDDHDNDDHDNDDHDNDDHDNDDHDNDDHDNDDAVGDAIGGDEGQYMISDSKSENSMYNKNCITCTGCRYPFQPNQLAHMDYGGCLYNNSDDSDDSDESE